jgi:ribonuclease-3 family protein
VNLILEKDAMLLPPLYLAFIGDAVWQYNIRGVLLPALAGISAKAGEMHKIATQYECANFQSELYKAIEATLTETERGIVNRARNTHNNNVPKSAGLANYKRATSLETLIGFWHLTGGAQKIDALLDIVKTKGGQHAY